MNANTVETCLFAAGDERGKVRQGPTDRNSESNADPRHLTTFPHFQVLITATQRLPSTGS